MIKLLYALIFMILIQKSVIITQSQFIMGNIELIKAETIRKSIFNKNNNTPFKKSPATRFNYSNEKKQNFSEKANKTCKISHNSFFKKNVQKDNAQIVKPMKTERKCKVEKNIKQQSKLNRVSNFNHLIKEIKRQMTQNQENTFNEQYLEAQLEQTLKINDKQIKKAPSNRELVFNLTLQNQKLDMQKYKNIVQRQLSRTHSIQNISLQAKKSNQAILVVKYEENSFKNDNKQDQIQTMQTARRHNQKLQSFCFKDNEIFHHSAFKINQEQSKYDNLMEKTKQIMKQMQNRTIRLQKILGQEEKKLAEISKIQKVQKISSLIKQLQKIHENQINFENNLRLNIIDSSSHEYEDTESDCSGTFAYN